jgi:putative component of membrane protein insertase Oxa1/YidC/SpoIIIJ protein YidD
MRWPWLLLAALAALILADAFQPPARQVGVRLALGAIDAWQAFSTRAPGDDGRRLTPTCSVYGELAVRRYGAYRGAWLASKRIWRCNPWNRYTGEDWLD